MTNKELERFLEKEIVGVYDNDTILLIIEYLQKRHEDIEKQLEEQYIEENRGVYMKDFNYNEFKKEFLCGDLCGLEYLEKTIVKDYKRRIGADYSYYDYIVNLYNAVRCLNECMFIYEQTKVKNSFKYDLYCEARDLLFKELNFDLEDLFKEV